MGDTFKGDKFIWKLKINISNLIPTKTMHHQYLISETMSLPQLKRAVRSVSPSGAPKITQFD